MNARTLSVAIFVLGGLASIASAASPIVDKNLEAAIREERHEPKNELTDEMLKNVYFLDAAGKGIKDLTGLEKCINLGELRLSHNKIVDLKPLKGLTNLQSLDLSHNQIVDIGPLGGLVKLQRLVLSDNKIKDISALRLLGGKSQDPPALTSLYLSDNQVADLAPIAGLTRLSMLILAKNKIKDISALSRINRLMDLDLKDNEIGDISALKSQEDLKMLFLQGNKITDLSPLVEAASVDAKGPMRFAPFLNLWLAGNPLSEMAKTKQLGELKSLGVRLKD
jgi:Leucine-rich repeat (LRR) protein